MLSFYALLSSSGGKPRGSRNIFATEVEDHVPAPPPAESKTKNIKRPRKTPIPGSDGDQASSPVKEKYAGACCAMFRDESSLLLDGRLFMSVARCDVSTLIDVVSDVAAADVLLCFASVPVLSASCNLFLL